MKVPTLYTPQTRPTSRQTGYLNAGQSQVRLTAGDSLTQYAERWRREEEKADLFDVSHELINETNELQKDFEARKNSAPLGAMEFANETDAAYQARHKEILGKYEKLGYGKNALNELETRLGSMRSAYLGQAITFQHDSYKQMVGTQIDDSSLKLSQYVTNNPEGIVSAEDELSAQISNATGITRAEQSQYFNKSVDVLRITAGKSFAMREPDEVIRLLAPEDITVSEETIQVSGGGSFELGAYMRANRGAESSGDDQAKNTESSATGRYQFTDKTWLHFYKQAHPTSRESDEVIYAKRKNGDVQDTVMETFTRHNIAKIEAIGKPVTNGNAYLMHFLGEGDGIRVLKADPSTPIEQVVEKASINANAAVFKNVKTAGDIINWAASKMPSGEGGTTTETVRTEHTNVLWPGALRETATPPAAPVNPHIPGNLPLETRFVVGYDVDPESPVRTITITKDQGEVLIPTIINGRSVADHEAIEHYEETGEHYGVFKDADEAAQYTEWLQTRHETDLAPTGNPVLDRLSGTQRMELLTYARSERDKKRASNRAQLEVDMANEQAALFENGEYAGRMVTQGELSREFGPVVGQQKWEEMQSIRAVGPFTKSISTESETTMRQKLAALKPTDTSDPAYATKLSVYEAAEKAVTANLEARQADPAAYVMSNFGNIRNQLANAETADQRRAAYIAMNKAYDRLGIPADNRPIMTKEMADAEAQRYKTLTGTQKMQTVQGWWKEMPINQLRAHMMQLADAGSGWDMLTFLKLKDHPQYDSVMRRVMTGKEIIDRDPSRKPSYEKVNALYRAELGAALQSIDSRMSNVLQESANALYIQAGGDPKLIDNEMYRDAVRQAVGGLQGNKDTGIVNMRRGSVQDKTILPTGVTGAELRNWRDTLVRGELTALSLNGQPPVDTRGKGVPLRDIIENGVFVQVDQDTYIIKMGNSPNGARLMRADGNPFMIKLTPQTIRRK